MKSKASDDAASHLSTFRLCDLPVDVQNRIWEYCLELKAVLHHTKSVETDSTYTLPSMQSGKKALLEDTKRSEKENEDDAADDAIPHNLGYRRGEDPNDKRSSKDSAVLTFKLNVSIPLALLQTSKATTNALQNVLTLSEPRITASYTKTFQSSVNYHRITSPPADFLHLWSQAHLILADEIPSSIFLLSQLPRPIAPKNLIITTNLLDPNLLDPKKPAVHAAWSSQPGHSTPFFAHYIDTRLPSLRTISIQIPGTYRQMEEYWQPAPAHFISMLKSGRLDTVFFFYVGTGNSSLTDEWFLPGKLRVDARITDSREELDLSEDEWEDEDDEMYWVGRLMREIPGVKDGDFDVVLEVVSSTEPKAEVWRCVGAERVVRITRAEK